MVSGGSHALSALIARASWQRKSLGTEGGAFSSLFGRLLREGVWLIDAGVVGYKKCVTRAAKPAIHGRLIQRQLSHYGVDEKLDDWASS